PNGSFSGRFPSPRAGRGATPSPATAAAPSHCRRVRFVESMLHLVAVVGSSAVSIRAPPESGRHRDDTRPAGRTPEDKGTRKGKGDPLAHHLPFFHQRPDCGAPGGRTVQLASAPPAARLPGPYCFRKGRVIMKRILLGILVLSLAGLVGCAKGTSGGPGATN